MNTASGDKVIKKAAKAGVSVISKGLFVQVRNFCSSIADFFEENSKSWNIG
jgi:hypothetical protein